MSSAPALLAFVYTVPILGIPFSRLSHPGMWLNGLVDHLPQECVFLLYPRRGLLLGDTNVTSLFTCGRNQLFVVANHIV